MKNDTPKPYITKCAKCKGEIRLLKYEPMKVYHGDCWFSLNKKVGEK
jgi:hypothetical protein